MSEQTRKAIQERRMKMFRIAPQVFHLMARGTFRVMSNPAPKDAVIVRSCYDYENDLFVLVLAHPDFPVVERGRMIPAGHSPVIERVEEDAWSRLTQEEEI